LGATFDQAVEEEAVDALGLGVGSIAGIEIGGVGFDDKDEMRRRRNEKNKPKTI
jgi:hypothetical protein